MQKASQIVSFIIDAIIIAVSMMLFLVAMLFVPLKKTYNVLFLVAIFILLLTSAVSLTTDVFSLSEPSLCPDYIKIHLYQADPSVIICLENIRAIVSAVSFALLVLFAALVLVMKGKFLKRSNYRALMMLIFILLALFIAVFFTSLLQRVASYEALGLALQTLAALVAVLLPLCLLVVELALLRQKYRVFMCQEPEGTNYLAEICNCNYIRGVIFNNGKLVQRKQKSTLKSPLLNVKQQKFNLINCLSFASSVCLFLSVVFFLHIKFGWGESASVAEFVVLQIFYALFSVTSVFLLTGYAAYQRARSVVEVLNSKSEAQYFKIFVNERGNIGYYNLYMKLLYLKVLYVGDGCDEAVLRVKADMASLQDQLNCGLKQDYENLERLCKSQLQGCFMQFQAQSIAYEDDESKNLWDMIIYSIRRLQGKELVLCYFICGEFD